VNQRFEAPKRLSFILIRRCRQDS